MRALPIVFLIFVTGIAGCGVEEFVRRNDDRYAKPGAMDSPLTGIYNTYQFAFLNRFVVTHQWTETGCDYRSLEESSTTPGRRTHFYTAPEIYEDRNGTWQASNTGRPPMDFNRFVRSVKHQQPVYAQATTEEATASVAKALERARRSSRTGIYETPPPDTRKPIRYEEMETGFRPLCYESWWTTSHSLSLRLHKLTLVEFEAMFSERYPEGKWSSQVLDGREWRVQETPIDKLRPRRGVGGPYRTWVTSIGDTGYVIALEMTASQDSLPFPQAHAAIEDVCRHLIASVRIEPLTR